MNSNFPLLQGFSYWKQDCSPDIPPQMVQDNQDRLAYPLPLLKYKKHWDFPKEFPNSWQTKDMQVFLEMQTVSRLK